MHHVHCVSAFKYVSDVVSLRQLLTATVVIILI